MAARSDKERLNERQRGSSSISNATAEEAIIGGGEGGNLVALGAALSAYPNNSEDGLQRSRPCDHYDILKQNQTFAQQPFLLLLHHIRALLGVATAHEVPVGAVPHNSRR